MVYNIYMVSYKPRRKINPKIINRSKKNMVAELQKKIKNKKNKTVWKR